MITIVMPPPIVAPARNQHARCGSCGNTGSPADTVVIDWRVQLICASCVARHTWEGWTFDPVLNTYRHA